MPEALERSPVAPDEYSCWLPRHRKSGSAARRLLRGFLAGLAGGELYVTAGELVLTELVNNAVQHARTPPGRLLMVRFELWPRELRVEVHDASTARPAVQAAGPDDERGRGLWLVEQLTTGWGCGPREGGIGKLVWAAIAPAAGDAE
ncbi:MULTISPECIES: ATP-binding protein [Kitasatospora]|uniref:Histidine kinase/HSP90-like ATPase domain-containing protein n=1 Tax=Kitasatospora cystarginea TaxID=58350 RepID=A0ABP5QPE4_9ACTN